MILVSKVVLDSASACRYVIVGGMIGTWACGIVKHSVQRTALLAMAFYTAHHRVLQDFQHYSELGLWSCEALQEVLFAEDMSALERQQTVETATQQVGTWEVQSFCPLMSHGLHDLPPGYRVSITLE